MASETLVMLLAVHRAPVVPLKDICSKYFGCKPAIAARRARLNRLPVPAYRLATQKSPWVVNLTDLAEYLDTAHGVASKGWLKSNA